MINKFVFLLLTLSFIPLFASSNPSIVLKNQYGEVANDYLVGGSNQISAKFIVDSVNANGLGQRSLSTFGATNALNGGISNVYMNTSATPAAGNPNPSPGYIVVQFANGYSGHLVTAHSVTSPAGGSNVSISSGLSQGKPYIISVLGTSTAAQFQAVGLPTNLTPTVSQSFIATTGLPSGGTGQVQLAAAAGSTISTIEALPGAALGINTANGTGGQILLQCLAPTNSGTTTKVATAPAAGSVIELQFVLTPVAGSPL